MFTLPDKWLDNASSGQVQASTRRAPTYWHSAVLNGSSHAAAVEHVVGFIIRI
jgi:hypothetical protein